MAVTSLWPVHGRIKTVIDYAENPDKTMSPDRSDDDQGFFNVLKYIENSEKTSNRQFVTGINCMPDTATEQMVMTKMRYGKTDGTVAFHGYQSFRYNEATPELAHQIGVQMAREIWGDQFEVVVSTHLNTDSIHNHFVINSVSFKDGKRLNDNKALHRKIREISDNLCRQNDLSVIENQSPTKTPRNIWIAEKQGLPTRYNVMRQDIDRTIDRSYTVRFFYNELRRMGYIIRYDDNRKYATIQIPGTPHPTRFKTLGEEYTEDRIEERILEKDNMNRYCQEPEQIKRYDFSAFRLRSFYLFYCEVLECVEANSNHPYYNAALREDIRRMDEYSKQAILLGENKIDTMEQLTAYMDVTKAHMDVLIKERNQVYSAISRCQNEPDLPLLIAKRDELTAQISKHRRDLKNARCIKERSQPLREKMQQVQESELRREHPERNISGYER